MQSVATADYAPPIIDTLRHCGLESKDYVVFGGAALALHGIRPASDVDLVVQPWLFVALASDQQTPSGIKLERKPAGWVDFRLLGRPVSDTGLRIDLSSFVGYGRADRFNELRQRADSISVQGEPISLLSLPDLLATKSHSWRLKDRLDIRRIRKFSLPDQAFNQD